MYEHLHISDSIKVSWNKENKILKITIDKFISQTFSYSFPNNTKKET